MKKNKIFLVLNIIPIIFILTSTYIRFYINFTAEQLIFSLKFSEGTSITALKEGIIFVLIGIIIILFILKLIKILYYKTTIHKIISNVKMNLCFKLGKKKFTFKLIPFTIKTKIFLFLIFLILSILYSFSILKIMNYISKQFQLSTLFEDYYVNPRDVEITFPENKKNLIYIYVESLEMSSASIKNGGLISNDSYIPNLEKVAQDNINFSDKNNLGGAHQVSGTGWTVAGMVATTSGIPLKIAIDQNEYIGYESFLPGAYSLGEILKENGYKNYIMMGSDSDFGGRKDYFKQHGDYEIFDYNWALHHKKIDKGYYVWWGFEDKKLYDFAKEELSSISKNNEPFNFTLLTADTHFVNGYNDKTCEQKYNTQYSNVIYCTDKMLNEFLNWLKDQPYYDDTVIILTGDHLTMQKNFYNDSDKDKRTVYNAILNSQVSSNTYKNRLFTTMDMYPTTLASLGASMNSDRLGLGTNLFTEKKTLSEEMGLDKLDDEISKRSNFYDYNLLGGNYFDMQKKTS